MDSSVIKRNTGRKAIDTLVKNRMKLGMGTGSTAIEALRRLAEKIREGTLTEIYVVPTSLQTEIECRKCGISLCSLNDPVIGGTLDLTIDGADEVDPHWNLIKGGGGAHLMEKIIGFNSKRYAIVVDKSKIVDNLGTRYPIPVEVLPAALLPVTRKLEQMGAAVCLREAVKIAGPVITQQGNLILDATFPAVLDPLAMEQAIKMIPGVLENGIFTIKVTDLFIGNKDGSVEYQNRE